MDTISFNIEENYAEIIRKEAKEHYTTVSQYMRKLMIELYKNKTQETNIKEE